MKFNLYYNFLCNVYYYTKILYKNKSFKKILNLKNLFKNKTIMYKIQKLVLHFKYFANV